jgi:NAD(P)H dehydrogenase (quinone)
MSDWTRQARARFLVYSGARLAKESDVILVTGATGRVGYHLMELLADAGAEATAMVRVEARGTDLPGTAGHLVASLEAPPPASVLREFDRVFLLSPAEQEQAALETVFIDALVAAGHRPHVVKVVADGFADPGVEVRFVLSHRDVALHLDATGLPVTYLAPSLYMETLLEAAGTIREFVAARDVAAVAARVLTSPGHEDATYVLTGPEALSYADVAERVSEVFARQVDYENQTASRARKAMLDSGLDRWAAEGRLELFEWIRQGGADTVTTTVREVTGADPQPIEDWLENARAGFTGPPPDTPPPPF